MFKFYYPEIWDINFIKVHNCIITSSLIVESELIKKIGGFREIQTKNHYSDYDCWLGLLTHSDCYYFKEPFVLRYVCVCEYRYKINKRNIK